MCMQCGAIHHMCMQCALHVPRVYACLSTTGACLPVYHGCVPACVPRVRACLCTTGACLLVYHGCVPACVPRVRACLCTTGARLLVYPGCAPACVPRVRACLCTLGACLLVYPGCVPACHMRMPAWHSCMAFLVSLWKPKLRSGNRRAVREQVRVWESSVKSLRGFTHQVISKYYFPVIILGGDDGTASLTPNPLTP